MITNNIRTKTFEKDSLHSLGYGTQFQPSSGKRLEKIVSENDIPKGGNIIERLFFDKSKNLKATVNALLEEIENRRKLNCSLVNDIDREKSEINSDLMQLGSLKIHYDFERDKERSKSRLTLEERAQRLEEEKRKEAVDCWRDMMFLRKYLMSALKDYWDVVKRQELLEG